MFRDTKSPQLADTIFSLGDVGLRLVALVSISSSRKPLPSTLTTRQWWSPDLSGLA